MSVRKWFYNKVYLKSTHWREVATIVKARAGFRCEVQGCPVTKGLQAHHSTYKVKILLGLFTVSILWRELDYLDLLYCLCNDHHERTHEGEDLRLRDGRMLKAFSYE
jgi:hypothetical protein